MSSFEPGALLLETKFVPDPADDEAPGFEHGGDAPEAEEVDEVERSWLLGYAAGRDAARAALPCSEAADLERAADTLAAASEQLLALQQGSLAAQRRGVVELALSIAERILRHELTTDSAALEALVEHAAASLSEEGPLALELSTSDHGVIEKTRAPRWDALRAARGLELSASPELQPGEFRLRAGHAEVDARTDTLLGIVREALEECLAQSGEGASVESLARSGEGAADEGSEA